MHYIMKMAGRYYEWGSTNVRYAVAVALLTITIGSLNGQTQEPVYDPETELQKFEQIQYEASDRLRDGGHEDIEGRDEWFSFQRRYPYDRIPAGKREEAVREMKGMQQRLRDAAKTVKGGAQILAQNQWQEIGPINQGGRVRAVTLHPNPDSSGVFYIGAAGGGVWKTTDNGSTWYTTFDTVSALTMGAIGIDPVNPDNVYAGTGENQGSSSDYFSNGMFKSTDGGLSWKSVGLATVGAFSKIVVHNTKPNIVYAATTRNGGFYYSTNGGESWEQTSSSVGSTVYDLVVNPQNNDEIFISTPNFVFRSTDAGVTFEGRATGIATSGLSRISIAVAPSQPNKLYALAARPTGANSFDQARVYVTTNSGGSWTLIKQLDDSFFRSQGFYNNCIAVHPEDPNTVLAGGIDIYRSEDGGMNWENITQYYQQPNNPDRVHADQHVFAFDPNIPGLVYVGNDGGVYMSFDAGISWDELSMELPITQYYAMEIDQRVPFRVYGGTQDNGTSGTFGTNGHELEWHDMFGGDGFYVVVDLSDSRYIYVENFNGTPVHRIDISNPNNPESFRIDGKIFTIDQNDQGLWSSPMIMSPVDKKSFYLGKRNLWRTRQPQNGNEWDKLTPLDGFGGRISAIGLSPHDINKVIVGSSSGSVRYSLDEGATWSTSSGLPNQFPKDLVYDPVDPNRVYATYSGFGSGHVYRSDDNGASFTNISTNLPNIPVNAVDVDPQNNQHLFVGTDVGVFVTLNGGGLWFPYSEGLALSPIVDMKIHRDTRMLVAATHGRSMFTVSIDNIESAPSLVSPVGGETVQTPGALEISWIGLTGPVKISVSYDGGEMYEVIEGGYSGTSYTLKLPLIKTSRARIKVEETTGEGRVLESADFTLSPTNNLIDKGERSGLKAEAVAVRGSILWVSNRDDNKLYRFRLPLLIPAGGNVEVNGLPGQIRDLTYDPTAQFFYVLVADPDFTNASVHVVDTTGAVGDEVTLPVGTVRGITMTPQGLALITPGTESTLYLVDPADGTVVESWELQGAEGDIRAGLAWDTFGYTQGVTAREPGALFQSELQRLLVKANGELEVANIMPLVASQNDTVVFVGLDYFGDESDTLNKIYIATDTSGAFYQINQDVTTGVRITPFIASAATTMAIAGLVPNPFREEALLELDVRKQQRIVIDLYSSAGEKARRLYEGKMEAGTHSVVIPASGLSSGIYYVTIAGSSGERIVRSVVHLR